MKESEIYLKLTTDDIKQKKIIFGGPGSGKTELIIKKLINFLENYEENSKNILILSFTRSAVYEIYSRLKKNKVDVSNVIIMTFDRYSAILQLTSLENNNSLHFYDYNQNIKNAIILIKKGMLQKNGQTLCEGFATLKNLHFF